MCGGCAHERGELILSADGTLARTRCKLEFQCILNVHLFRSASSLWMTTSARSATLPCKGTKFSPALPCLRFPSHRSRGPARSSSRPLQTGASFK